MIKNYRNYTSCIYSNNLELIEQNIINILEKEGCNRIDKPPLPMSYDNLRREYWRLMREFWIIGLFVGSDGWTILKTNPNELFGRRAINSNHPRLSELATACNCNIFHWGAYDCFYILLEANANGYIHVSGAVDQIGEEANKFYEENINSSDTQFYLLDVADNLKEAINYISPEERERKKKE